MARPLKHTVDYFPHFVNTGKTLLILQNEFGNDGYAFWFKLLSLLCKTDGQVYDYNNPASWRLLLAETHVSEDIANRILKLLADINTIDPELYLAKIVWVQNLVDNLGDVFTRRRNGSVPERPVNANINPVNANESTQTRPDHTIPDHTRPDQLSQNFELFEPHKVTELVTLNIKQGHPDVTETVTLKLPKQELSGYRNSNLTTPELASPKESIKEILNKYTTTVREILEELLKLSGWGNSQLANDAEWLSEFLVEYPTFSISHIRQCRDYHSDKRSQKKSQWKSRLRNWMNKDRAIQAQGDRHAPYRGNPSQKAAGAFDDLES